MCCNPIMVLITEYSVFNWFKPVGIVYCYHKYLGILTCLAFRFIFSTFSSYLFIFDKCVQRFSQNSISESYPVRSRIPWVYGLYRSLGNWMPDYYISTVLRLYLYYTELFLCFQKKNVIEILCNMKCNS